MSYFKKIEVSRGIYWVEIEEINLRLLCGSPADSVKHLMKMGLILTKEENSIKYESGPNAILLSDIMLQNGNFSNMAEFPVLQMLYRQGMIIPNHPNNRGDKPMLIGSKEQVNSQMEYIYRGNYGLTSERELIEAGAKPKLASVIMKMKLKFAFGKIHQSKDFIDSRILEDDKEIEIKSEFFIKRVGINIFELSYKKEKLIVNLNLLPNENYESPYKLGLYNFKREYFSIIHSGQGDGWDINQPCMSSILMYQGKIYLIDAGPNILYTLTALGISINEIEGIFHTHSHDDHFAGLTTLIRADHKIKYFSTPIVRASVTKKLSALLSIDEDRFFDFFEVYDLEFGLWSDIDGLEVRPTLSPHPVETAIFTFRTLWKSGYKSYSHFADISSFKTLKSMIVSDSSEIGISKEFYQRVVKEYTIESSLKKIDIGGGLIHGEAIDFKSDKSEKIVLAHIARDLTKREKEIGSGATFGSMDTLIPVQQNYYWRYAYEFLTSYFPATPINQIRIILNNEVTTFNPDTIIVKEGDISENIYLILTGTVEMIKTEADIYNIISAGSMIADISSLIGIPSTETYRAISYVQALVIPRDLYYEFVKKNRLYSSIEQSKDKREFLYRTWLFGEEISYPIQNKIAQSMKKNFFKKGYIFEQIDNLNLFLIEQGLVESLIGDKVIDRLSMGDFFGEDSAVFNIPNLFQFRVVEDLTIFEIGGDKIRDIPIVRWKLLEIQERRKSKIIELSSYKKSIFEWQREYSVNIATIDMQHQEIFKLAKKLFNSINKAKEKNIVRENFKRLLDYIKFHFEEEEAILKKYHFSNFRNHSKKHRELLLEIDKLELCDKELKQEGELVKLIQEWIVNHILDEDRRYSRFLNEKGVF